MANEARSIYDKNCMKRSMKFAAMLWYGLEWLQMVVKDYVSLKKRLILSYIKKFLTIFKNHHRKISVVTIFFQHYLVPSHKSVFIKSWLYQNPINVLPWPANSLDLNSINNLQRITKKMHGIELKKKVEFLSIIKFTWLCLAKEHYAPLIARLAKRVRDVIKCTCDSIKC